jgi:ATP:ADP antiporter, AAA family
MPGLPVILPATPAKSRLDRFLSLFTDVRAGEGVTALLMLANIFLLLVCYSVIKTVREPLILLGGGAEVRSYAAAGQALLLMGFVPLYSYVASNVGRMTLIVGVTLFFVGCIELFAAAVAARVPFVGVAFFIWVGIFNISLVAQFWSFANDIYRREAGDRLFPIIMIGMTAGAPLGSFVAARLFKAGLAPQTILQLSAVLLTASVLVYLLVNRRAARRTTAPSAPLDGDGGFALVLANPYLRLVAVLVILLNVVNTTGEYVVARLLTAHVAELAQANPGLDRLAYIGAFSGEYQFWVNVTALLLQAFVTSRLVKYRGLQGALLALPLIALGGYALIAAGVGFSVVRWIKTAENATDYSVMNTARQLLWLPTSRDEKYKAKQAIDTFAVRIGDLLSAAVVFGGTSVLHLGPGQFAIVNVGLTLAWIGVALAILRPSLPMPRLAIRPLAGAAAMLSVLLLPAVAGAQETREEQLAAERAKKAAKLTRYVPDGLERQIALVDRVLLTPRTFSPFIGGVLQGGGLAIGPAVRRPVGDTGSFQAHAAWSIRSYAVADATLRLPAVADERIRFELHGQQLHAPTVNFFGVGNDTLRDDRQFIGFDRTTVGAGLQYEVAPLVTVGGGLDWLRFDATAPVGAAIDTAFAPAYSRGSVFAAIDSRTSPGYTRGGGLYRIDLANYDQVNGSSSSFRRADAEVQQYIPVGRESQVIALRALASTTLAGDDATVPYFLLPDLGGPNALRGYSNWRFRDRNRLLLTAEYRWAAGPLVDMALFVDAGKVGSRIEDLGLRDLHTSYGIGFNVHTPSSTVTRIAIARSREGIGLIFSFSPNF